VTLVGAWGELPNDFRHFRVNRLGGIGRAADNGRLTAEWLALRKDRPDASA
jgi:hypothetical protein